MQLGADCSAAGLPTMNQLQPLEAENFTDPTNLFSSSPMGSSHYINPYFMNANFPYLDSSGFHDGLPDMSLQNQKQLPELTVDDLDYFTTAPASGTTNLNHPLRDGNLSSLNTGFQDGEMNIEGGNAMDDNLSFDYTEFLEMMKDGDAEVQMDGKFSFPNTDCQDGGEINNRNSEAKIASEPTTSGCHYSDTIQPEPALSDLEQNYEEEQQASGKKRRYRHTNEQIEKLEAALKTCPNPNDNKRAKLSKELGLTPSQVKFWFQNRRTQMRVKKGRSENETLKTENDNLRRENERLKEGKSQLLTAIRKMEYANARMSYEGQQLRRENTRLKQELCMRFGNKPF